MTTSVRTQILAFLEGFWELGCGSSSAAGASKPGSKDPEDHYVDLLEFKKLGIPSLDEYLSKVETPVNTVIELSNSINECIDDVRDAVAAVVGALRIELDISGAVSHDTFYLSVAKADGYVASKDELKELFSKDAVKAADDALASATKTFYNLKPSGLGAAGDALVGENTESVNKAIEGLKTALGDGYKVTVMASASLANSAAAVSARVMKPYFEAGAEDYSLKTASFSDILSSGESKAISSAQMGVAEATSSLAKAIKEAEGKGITVDCETKKKKILIKMEGGEGDEAAACKTAVKSALSSANSSIFKLFKACANAQGDVNLTRAIIVLVESLIDNIAKLATGEAKDAIKKAIKLKTDISLSEEGEFMFDFDIEINLPDFEGRQWTELLTAPAKCIYNTIMECKDKLVESFATFTEISEQLNAIIEGAPGKDELKTEMEEKFKNDSPMVLMKTMSKVTGNLSVASNSPKTLKVFISTGNRIYMDLDAGIKEVQKILEAV
eukprot:gene3309-13335_t